MTTLMEYLVRLFWQPNYTGRVNLPQISITDQAPCDLIGDTFI